MKPDEPSAESVVVECDFEEAPEILWRALTEPALLAAWLLTDETGRERGARPWRIVTAEPYRLLRYRWRDRCGETTTADGDTIESVVTVELSRTREGGTHLRLVQDGFRLVRAQRRPGLMRALQSRGIARKRSTRSASARHSWRRAA